MKISFCVKWLRPEDAPEAQQWQSGARHLWITILGGKGRASGASQGEAARYEPMSAGGLQMCSFLVTGHTMDDQAETVLMRQARTDTAESLAGIWETANWNGVKLLRPLLGQQRAELRAYLKSIGQPWLDDPSNEDVKFERVRVRQALAHETRPDQRKMELAEIADKAGSELVCSATGWSRATQAYHEGFGIVPRAGFCELDPSLQRRVLLQLIQTYGAGSRAEPGELDHLAKWITGQELSRRTLGGAVLARREASVLIGREWARISPVPAIVPDAGEVLWDGRFLVRAPANSQIVPVGSVKAVARREDIPSFVQQSLPAVLLGDGGVAIPHLGLGSGVSAKFMRYLR